MSGLYKFGDFRLDASRRILLRANEPVALAPKAFDILLFLIQNRARALSKEELMQAIWPDTFVEEGNLKFNVSVIRKALGSESWIETLPRVGYRFAGEVEEEGIVPGQSAVAVAPIETPERAVVQVSVETDINPPSLRWGAVAAVLILIATGVWLWWRWRPQVDVHSIAVLPFRSLSAGPADREMELGLTDSLIGRLGAEGNWLVRPTGAVRGYTGVDRDPVAAGRNLQVDAVMDGSIQRSGDRVRLTLQLLRTSDGRHLWAEKFDEKLTDLFSMEDQIALDVSQALRVKLPRQAAAKAHTASPEVYELYLAGRHYFNEEKARTRQAVQNFELAIQKDRDFAPAYGMLALSYWQLSQRGVEPTPEIREKMRVTAHKAVELDDSRAEGHVAMAFAKMWLDFDWSGSEAEYRRALELNPNEPLAYVARGLRAMALGRFDEAEAAYRKKLDLDPRELMSIEGMGYPALYSGRNDEALEWFRKALQVDSNFPLAYHDIAVADSFKGLHREEVDALLKSSSLAGGNPERIAQRLRIFEAQGLEAFRRNELEELLNRQRDGKYVSPIALATMYEYLGEKQKALDALEVAYNNRTFQVLFLKSFPGWASLRGDPRYNKLVQAMRLSD